VKASFLLLTSLIATFAPVHATDAPPKNILMIAVDDLRPMLGCYGDKRIKTPNIDRLAASGMLFERAYCNYAKCGPSRLSLMTGLRPSSVQVYDHGKGAPEEFRGRRPDAVSMARFLKDQGFETRSFGKIDHDGWQIPTDWSAPPFAGRENEILEIMDPENPNAPTLIADRKACPVMQSPDVPDDHLFEGRMTSEVIRQLSERETNDPFFFAVGFRRPHLPFVAPKQYHDLYQPDESWLPSNPGPPLDAPPFAWFNSNGYVSAAKALGLTIPLRPTREKAIAMNGYEMRSYLGVPPEGSIPQDLQLDLIHAYAACVSYVDTQIGRLLDHLESNDLRENTIVLLWTDHGWHLGEMSAWGKMTNYEIATRVPLIVSVPGLTPGRTCSLVELVDLYPTLCELSSKPAPSHLEGQSFASILRDPEASTKEAVLHDYVRDKSGLTGKAIRTDRYRYVQWTDRTGALEAEELYDLQEDPNETVNLAAKDPTTATRLRKTMETLRNRPE
jgi:iduronate 2-sulfatase